MRQAMAAPSDSDSDNSDIDRSADARGSIVRGAFFAAPALQPGLYVVATPIGNLADVTLRALDTIAAADLVACEDTRVTRRLLERYAIRARMVSYHEHSSEGAHRRVLDALAGGKAVALVSDAGMPLVSDPGGRLVTDAIAAGHRVVPIPGASAPVAALAAAGLPVDAVHFVGFLPQKSAGRRQRLTELAAIPATLVIFESPNRIAATLVDAVETLGDRPAAVARELTKIYETFERGTLSELARRFGGTDVKGEIVLLVAPPAPAAARSDADLDAALAEALRNASVKDAVAFVAEMTGLPRRDLYQRALALKNAAP